MGLKVLLETIVVSTPILLASLGGAFTQLSGALNIGLEGSILISAFFSFFGTYFSSNTLIGIITGIGAAVILNVIIILLSEKLRANLFIVGLASNLFASGITGFIAVLFFKSKGTIITSDFPKVDALLKFFVENTSVGFNFFDITALVCIPIVYMMVSKTNFGLRLRATGYNPGATYASGINVFKMRFFSYILCGIMTGLAGASLSLSLGAFVSEMSGGRGWIALVVVFLSKGKPFWTALVALLMSFTFELSNILQTTSYFPPKLLLSLPYLLTLFVVILFSKKRGQEG
ncbi:ABC transporter permease [Kosmotoga pacifica]|uniref:ABC transporter permease n=1 Tax=Kosmotoga pacifica TaxID=1330330 RepID=A0A0G2ZDG7_9BACT|nr:ABC transporter permease [Kosmotoga pacifica]AKI96863.1 hypothetical protein IX53_02415 [Kosmotoga pacifica]